MKKIIFITLLFLCFANAIPAPGQIGITDVRFGFGGTYKQQQWTPVRITIENREKDLEGELSLIPDPSQTNPIIYKREVNLPKNSKQSFTLYMEAGYLYGNPQVKLELKKDVLIGRIKTKEIVKDIENIRNITQNDNLVLVVGEDDDGLSGVARSSGANNNITVVSLAEEFLPDRMYGYDGVDLLVMGDVRLSLLSESQREGIVNWVLSGGKLFVSTGQNGQIYKGSFLEPLLPVKLGNLQQISFPEEFEIFFNSDVPEIEVGNQLLAMENSLREGKVLLQRGFPLLVTSKHGEGTVIFSAVDVASNPIKKWDGKKNLIRYFLADYETDNYNNRGSVVHEDISNWLTNVPTMLIPSFGIVFLFVVVYIIIVGPVNYIFLKKRKKLELAWITIPIIVIVFCLVAIGIGYAKKGRSLIVRSFSFVETETNREIGATKTFFSVFSPKKSNYTIQSEYGKDFYSPFRSYNYQQTDNQLVLMQNDKTSLTNVEMNMWTMETLFNSSFCHLGKGFHSNLRLVENQKIVGNITNNSPYDFEFAYLMCFGRIVELKNFGKGGNKVSFNESDFGYINSILYSHSNEMSQAFNILRNYLEAFVYNVPSDENESWEKPKLIGIYKEPAIKIDIENNIEKREGLSLFIVDLPLKLEGKKLDVHPSLMDAKIVDYEAENFYKSYSSLKFRDGYFVADFVLPQEPLKIHQAGLKFNVSIGNFSDFELELFNWQERQWNVFPISSYIAINEVEDYFYAGVLRARLKANNQYSQNEISNFQLEVNGDF